MKLSFPVALIAAACTAATLLPLAAQAQSRVWRCPGNEYTNNANDAKAKGCRVVEGGNVTVVQGGVGGTSGGRRSASAAPTSSPAGSRVDSGEQRARDNDAKAILESELQKAEAKLAELQKEYNNGQPERRGDERNYQKYIDRVAELRANIARTEADVAGIRRELGRSAPAPSTPAPAPSAAAMSAAPAAQ